AEKIRAMAAAERYQVDAKGTREINEADNVLSDEARAGRLREKLLERIEGIVRESVKPMERIEGIKILHVDGVNGAGGGQNRNVTDEVIDSALRYRVQAPMIDNLMKEIGIEGGSLGRMTEVLRDAKDIAALSKDKKGVKPNGSNSPDAGKETGDDRDR
ncbi:MAG: flotillin family protein, partial [Rhizobiaceae bacterium]